MIAEQWKKHARDPVLCDTEAEQMPKKKGPFAERFTSLI